MEINGLTKGLFIIVTVAFWDVLRPCYRSAATVRYSGSNFSFDEQQAPASGRRQKRTDFVVYVEVIGLIVITPLVLILSSLAMEFNVVYSKPQADKPRTSVDEDAGARESRIASQQ